MTRIEEGFADTPRGRRSLFLRQSGFSWNEIAASVALSGMEILTPAAELVAPDGLYHADHLSASRHIVTVLWDHTRRQLPGGFSDVDRRLESRLYEAMARLAKRPARLWTGN
jgi:hypothetical protein